MLRARLIGGQLAKASRGELEMKLPVGLVNDAAGHVVLDPDLSVQAAVRTFFETFARTGSATATVRSFREQGLLFPRRLSTGAHKGEVAWGPLHHSRTLRVLKNPRYTGTFVYGRTQSRKLPGGKELRRQLPREQWHTVILGAHPGYISWANYEENLACLHDNARPMGPNGARARPGKGLPYCRASSCVGAAGSA